jgi:hypothetical protein
MSRLLSRFYNGSSGDRPLTRRSRAARPALERCEGRLLLRCGLGSPGLPAGVGAGHLPVSAGYAWQDAGVGRGTATWDGEDDGGLEPIYVGHGVGPDSPCWRDLPREGRHESPPRVGASPSADHPRGPAPLQAAAAVSPRGQRLGEGIAAAVAPARPDDPGSKLSAKDLGSITITSAIPARDGKEVVLTVTARPEGGAGRKHLPP